MVQRMAWRRPGDKPVSEPMVVSLPTHICVSRPQWINAPVHFGNSQNGFKSIITPIESKPVMANSNKNRTSSQTLSDQDEN